jgi:hypothetical protein
MIHNILILRITGENLYHKNFSNTSWNETLTSGFISAAFNFTQNTFGACIQDMELGPYRLLFEQGDNIILVVFFDKYDSIINVRETLIELKETIISKFGTELENQITELGKFKDLDEVVDKIISKASQDDLSDVLKSNCIKILDEFRSNPEIFDCDLITISGVPLLKEWNKDFLELCLRQMDAFWKSKNYVLDQIILSYEQRHTILHKINDKLVLSAQIRRNTPIGLATLLVEETASKIAKLS